MMGDSISAYYSRLGVMLLGTVSDGNCGIDVMCQMEQVEPSDKAMRGLRTDLSDYLIERAGATWMHELLISLQEMRVEDLQENLEAPSAPPPPAPASCRAARTSCRKRIRRRGGRRKVG